MPKELVAIAVQQPVLQDYEEGPVQRDISASKWNLAHPNGERS